MNTPQPLNFNLSAMPKEVRERLALKTILAVQRYKLTQEGRKDLKARIRAKEGGSEDDPKQ